MPHTLSPESSAEQSSLTSLTQLEQKLIASFASPPPDPDFSTLDLRQSPDFLTQMTSAYHGPPLDPGISIFSALRNLQRDSQPFHFIGPYTQTRYTVKLHDPTFDYASGPNERDLSTRGRASASPDDSSPPPSPPPNQSWTTLLAKANQDHEHFTSQARQAKEAYNHRLKSVRKKFWAHANKDTIPALNRRHDKYPGSTSGSEYEHNDTPWYGLPFHFKFVSSGHQGRYLTELSIPPSPLLGLDTSLDLLPLYLDRWQGENLEQYEKLISYLDNYQEQVAPSPAPKDIDKAETKAAQVESQLETSIDAYSDLMSDWIDPKFKPSSKYDNCFYTDFLWKFGADIPVPDLVGIPTSQLPQFIEKLKKPNLKFSLTDKSLHLTTIPTNLDIVNFLRAKALVTCDYPKSRGNNLLGPRIFLDDYTKFLRASDSPSQESLVWVQVGWLFPRYFGGTDDTIQADLPYQKTSDESYSPPEIRRPTHLFDFSKTKQV